MSRGHLNVGVLIAGVVVVFAAGRARAQDREFAFGLGYSELFWDGSHTRPLKEQGGAVLQGRLTWAATPDAAPGRPELRVGFGLDLAFYASHDDNGDVQIDNNGDVFATATDY